MLPCKRLESRLLDRLLGGVMRDTLPRSSVALKEFVVAELEATRMRTLGLLESVGEDDLERQHSPIMSPLVWDLAHIGYFEELWLLRRLDDDGPHNSSFDELYDAFRHP